MNSQQYVRTIYHIDVDQEPLRVPYSGGGGGEAVMYKVKLIGASFALNQVLCVCEFWHVSLSWLVSVICVYLVVCVRVRV